MQNLLQGCVWETQKLLVGRNWLKKAVEKELDATFGIFLLLRYGFQGSQYEVFSVYLAVWGKTTNGTTLLLLV
jgi:hypothetical protein